jgi:hypothetical protein
MSETPYPHRAAQVFDLRRQVASAWKKFLQPGTTSGIQELKLNLQLDLFPYYVRDRTVKVKEVYLLAEIRAENTGAYTVEITPALPEQQNTNKTKLTLSRLEANEELYGQLHFARYTAPETQRGDLGNWTIKVQRQNASDFESLEPNEIKNLVMVISFETVPHQS